MTTLAIFLPLSGAIAVAQTTPEAADTTLTNGQADGESNRDIVAGKGSVMKDFRSNTQL